MNQPRIIDANAFGPGRVQVAGQEVEYWGGPLPKSLFFFLINRDRTTRDEIFRTFWAHLTTRQATNIFHVTKGKLNLLLGKGWLIFANGFYRLSSAVDLSYDVIAFQTWVQAAEGATDEAAASCYKSAIALYRADFLEGMSHDWIVNRRQALSATYAEALVSLARLVEGGGNSVEALDLYLRAYTIAPLREDLIRALMRVYCQVGSKPLALETYHHFVKALKDTLKVSPDPCTVQLADEITVGFSQSG